MVILNNYNSWVAQAKFFSDVIKVNQKCTRIDGCTGVNKTLYARIYSKKNIQFASIRDYTKNGNTMEYFNRTG